MSTTPTNTLEELNALFAWNPPPLRLHPSSQQHVRLDTESTRQATFYNRHLAPDMICNRLVHVENLHNNIAAVVDEKLRSYNNDVTLPPQSGIVTKALRDSEVEETEDVMKDEMSVVEFYSKTTTRYCVRIASTIALHPATWSSLLSWSAIPCLGGRDIPGGSLQVLSLRTRGSSDEGGNSNSRRDFVEAQTWSRLMEAKDKYEDLATWRMVTPSTEDTSIMLGVMFMAYTGEFQWTLCVPSTTSFPSAYECPKLPSPQRALDSPEIRSLVGGLSSLDLESMKDVVADQILDDALRRGGSSFQSVLEHGPTPKKGVMAWSDSDTDATSSSLAPTRQLTPQSLLEEVWGQSVRQNTTVAIIHSGNLEYICIRHRASQTLYVSDILHVPRLKDPGYGKLQVGIYITAVEDAMRRVIQDISSSPATPSGSHPHGVASNTIVSPGKRTRGSGRRRPRKRGSGDSARNCADDESDDLEPNDGSLDLQASSRMVLYLRFQYDIYESIHPARFLRGPRPYVARNRTSRHTTPVEALPKNSHLLLILTSQLGHGAMGVTHGGFVQTNFKPGHSTLKVAAKLAFTDDQQEDILHEHMVYAHLKSKSVRGIPTVYGIFHDAELETGPSCLLMSHGGVSLRARNPILNPITSTQRDAFFAILRSIHDAKVLHRDLRLENLLVQDSGDVTIIDFDQARLEAEDGFENEYQGLRRLLRGFVKDAVESVEIVAASRAVETDEVSVDTKEIAGNQAKGKVVEVVGVDARTQDIALATDKHKAKAADAAPTSDAQTNVKAKGVQGRSKPKIPAGAAGTSGATDSGDGSGSGRSRMAGRMVLRSKPPQVRR